ncbi:metallophosphoesterase family protein [Rouxiella chamberiensis]|uniref:Metallophosphoesterase family protein n=1 Tax=Rouxiella chamberiensis TaxID=1513468 RepID=A0ABY7HRQ9_9GAMM|nr:metallophosphoesterase [Rouxiella chamberiensis]WAT02088.1 metallophosphoesterase family protein [Rouxiella chamberiensis]
MKLAVISDIHGNLPALNAVLADIQARSVDLILNLGDIVSGGYFRQKRQTGSCLSIFRL